MPLPLLLSSSQWISDCKQCVTPRVLYVVDIVDGRQHLKNEVGWIVSESFTPGEGKTWVTKQQCMGMCVCTFTVPLAPACDMKTIKVCGGQNWRKVGLLGTVANWEHIPCVEGR